jgi:tRNA-specific 2-thiouridylase
MTALRHLEPATKPRVVVAMSGGVDSSVAAALLKEQGYDVVGITLQLYDHGEASGRAGSCCAGQDIHDARRVADGIGIPHYVLDFERRFKAAVIDDFADAYLAGETPIPCVRCNQKIKFEELLGVARDLGAEALATGHYVRRIEAGEGPELHRGADATRDQSYFLFATTKAQLAFLRFPLGSMGKDETRDLARRLALPVADKRDSQDICFVPTGGYAPVLESLRPEAGRPGEIVGLDGTVLGRHQGIGRFTIGQRRGLGIAASEPLFVVRLEPARARVVVGPQRALLRRQVCLAEVNWLGDQPLAAEEVRVEVKLRSSQPAVGAVVRLDPAHAAGAEVVLDQPQAAVAPGQACVFYAGERVMGGGWIRREDR